MATPILGLNGKPIPQPSKEEEFKDNEFMNGERLVLSVYELEDKKGIKIIPGVKKLANPFALEQFLNRLYDNAKEDSLRVKIENIVNHTIGEMARMAMEQQQIAASVSEAAGVINKKSIS
jgi:hypothetical protein